MKVVEFTPLACKKEGALITGTIKLKMPSFTDKCELASKLELQLDDSGKVSLGSGDMFMKISKIVNASKDNILSVDMKYKDGSAELKSFDDLNNDDNGGEILTEVATILINGFSASKN